jgi:two-component system, chemotaxis family, response regulator PixG
MVKHILPNMYHFGTFTRLRPQSLLRQLSRCYDTTCLQAFTNLVSWSIYLERGTITYATHSVAPFDRLERHLRRLSQEIPGLTSETLGEFRLIFASQFAHLLKADDGDTHHQPADYQAIHWLINQGFLNHQQATVLIQELVKEVLESFLLIKNGTFALSNSQTVLSEICRLDVEKVIQTCEIQLHNWLSFAPYISSPYQRPYLLSSSLVNSENFPDIQRYLPELMQGLSLRHLAVMINQDEMELAKTLYPNIIKGGVILHEPDPPFDQLPRNVRNWSLSDYSVPELGGKNLVDIPTDKNSNSKNYDSDSPGNKFPNISTGSSQNIPELRISNNINQTGERVTAATIRNSRQVYKIVAVDDSPTILKEISRFLGSDACFVVTINEPIKAVMSIIRHQPDLILLDLNMPGIDGYELCRVIRNNRNFQETPVIFITGSKGIVDQVKARLVGATGYLKKPFTQLELHKIIFQHLR